MLTYSQNILVVEDDAHKLSSLCELVDAEFSDFQVFVARSVNGAATLLRERSYALAIIDMSLPSYDIIPGGRMGVPEGFGGEDLLRLIQDDYPATFMVVITQLTEFSDPVTQRTRSVDELASDLTEKMGSKYLGLVSYSGRYASWREELTRIVGKMLKEHYFEFSDR